MFPDNISTVAIIIGFVFVIIVRAKWRRVAQPQIIAHPRILLIQAGPNFSNEAELDKAIYMPYFSTVITKAVHDTKELRDYLYATAFDVVHLFIEVDEAGYIYTSAEDRAPLREIIDVLELQGTPYIILAKGQGHNGYFKGVSDKKAIATTVLTLDRRGDKFQDFYNNLFRDMSAGKTFAVAWNDITPQIPGLEHDNSPNSVAIIGQHNIILKGDR